MLPAHQDSFSLRLLGCSSHERKLLGTINADSPYYTTGPWSLKGWEATLDWHPTEPGHQSLSSEGGGFEWAFHWDPFLGHLSDIRYPDDDGVKKGLEKLLEEGSVNVQYDEKEDGREAQQCALAVGVIGKTGDVITGQRERKEGNTTEVVRMVSKGVYSEE